MSVDEKVSEEEKQKRDVLEQLLERTLATNDDWHHLYDRMILAGYTQDGSSLPLLLPIGGYEMVAIRHKELRDLFIGDILVYFSGDKKPSFCPISNLYVFVIEEAINRKLVRPAEIVKRILQCQKEMFSN